MRKLLAVIVIAALIWGGYWFVGALAVERGLSSWFAGRHADGWVADYTALNTAGFPNRFDTTIRNLQLTDPYSGIEWQAPFFQILALSYKPNHIIAVLPPRQVIGNAVEEITVESDRIRGSVVFAPGLALTLDHSAFVAENVALTSSAGWSSALREGRFATRQTTGRENAHDVAFEALGFAPTRASRDRVDPEGTLPDTVETLKIDAMLGFDAPWDRHAVEGARPNLTEMNLHGVQATWGTLDLRASGNLSIDGMGVPTGRIELSATNWREMLVLAVKGGLLPEALAGTVEKGLGLLAGMSGDATTLQVPLSFQNGFMSFGPVPLGPAPRLRLRE